ncbi:MAG: hypothetical protein PHF82_04980 [Lutispora sp.]|nr:hypothetical protein [Lutispora sp.]MDD2481472.1 hypothetical protein [Lutispora sp.]
MVGIAHGSEQIGDSDIMLDTGKGMYFDHVVLGNYFKHYRLPEFLINSISWHGYYQDGYLYAGMLIIINKHIC